MNIFNTFFNLDSLTTLYIVYIISIIIHIIAAALTAITVIPLQAKEAMVKNGLAKLRKQLLAKGILSFVVAVVSVGALAGRFLVDNNEHARYLVLVFVVTHSLGLLGKAVIDYQVYHQQYTPLNMLLHERFAKYEEKHEEKKRKKS